MIAAPPRCSLDRSAPVLLVFAALSAAAAILLGRGAHRAAGQRLSGADDP
jgi:hypothetical protein